MQDLFLARLSESVGRHAATPAGLRGCFKSQPRQAQGQVKSLNYHNGVRSGMGSPAVAGVEQERAILRCMSVGTVDVRLQKETRAVA